MLRIMQHHYHIATVYVAYATLSERKSVLQLVVLGDLDTVATHFAPEGSAVDA